MYAIRSYYGSSGQILTSTGTGLAWVDTAGIGGTYTAGNGLTLSGSQFKFGGAISENTRLNIGNTEVMYIDYATGNIGVGTTYSTYKLNLSGAAYFENTIAGNEFV